MLNDNLFGGGVWNFPSYPSPHFTYYHGPNSYFNDIDDVLLTFLSGNDSSLLDSKHKDTACFMTCFNPVEAMGVESSNSSQKRELFWIRFTKRPGTTLYL